MFIAIEGPNGVGKSTTVQSLAELLRQSGETVMTTSEPTDTALGRSLRGGELYLTGPILGLGVAFDRLLHVQDEIAPAISQGSIVISDRYVPSSLVLQRIDGMDQEWIIQANRFAPAPDLTVYLTGDPEVMQARLAAREGRSRLEKMGSPGLELQYYRDARDQLLRLGWHQVEVDCRDKSPKIVAAEIAQYLDQIETPAYK
ncbi:dTMP kinase [Agreia sp. VKM Ac-1783]|uniref:dTMP kinase n=1 Tax=Agreia sp. VKM Ac-1783 TaxID=1938889 RepID=UPI000A2AD6DB|nr:dTMP kinase [Agreia sp. VKM Ac-1783]SMQ71920.1 dTMP kinase [Agreia sp. VKM Ac-1783]